MVRIYPSREKSRETGKNKRVFCSKECYDEYQRKHPLKMWDEGLTAETDERIRMIAEKRRGHKRTDEQKERMCEGVRRSFIEHPERREVIARNNKHSYGICGVRPDLGQFFRSRWEANVARIFRYEGIEYKYEGKGMAFNLGDTTYLVDFYIPARDLWIEVKGFATTAWKAKAKKLKIMHNISPLVIGLEEYRRLERFYASKILRWEKGNGYGASNDGTAIHELIEKGLANTGVV
jgi:hypothetical protein